MEGNKEWGKYCKTEEVEEEGCRRKQNSDGGRDEKKTSRAREGLKRERR